MTPEVIPWSCPPPRTTGTLSTGRANWVVRNPLKSLSGTRAPVQPAVGGRRRNLLMLMQSRVICSLSGKNRISYHPTDASGIMLGNKIRPACFPQHRNPACDAAQMMFPSVVCATRRLILQQDGNLRIDANCTANCTANCNSGENCTKVGWWYSDTYGKGVVELRAQVKCSLYLGI